MVVSINPKSFQDTPICDLPFEEALKIGARRSEDLRPMDFRETSIRFCVVGLRDWLSRYSKDYSERSFFYTIRDASWHWASYCSTNPVLVSACADYRKLSREIVETSSFTELVERLQQPSWLEKFGYASQTPCNILLPLEVMGVVGEVGEAIGISFSKLFQVGLGWSLSTNKQGLYAEWIKDIFNPLFAEVMKVAKERSKVIRKVKNEYEFLLCEQLREQAEQEQERLDKQLK
jgi:hypothetical protein